MGLLERLGIDAVNHGTWIGTKSYGWEHREPIKSISPIDDSVIAEVSWTSEDQYEEVIEAAQKAFLEWRQVPAPQRGEIVRQIGEALREHKEDLGRLVTLENGKIFQEGLGEVQEMIDICDFALGLSRKLYGYTMQSERPRHRLFDQYHPLGIVGVISSFNFPVAVWSWNAMIAAVCGDVIVWKASSKTPLTALACQKIAADVMKKNGMPEAVFNLITTDRVIGERMALDKRIPLISATGSTAMGQKVGPQVSARLGKSILELGGNNAIIISEHADIEMAVRATVFGAVGTAGQRCTSTRRLIVQSSIFDQVKERLIEVYKKITIGDPFDENVMVGPMIDQGAVEAMQKALKNLKSQGGEILYGGEPITEGVPGGNYVRPALCLAKNEYPIVQEETFAPILYLIRYEKFEDAIRMHNDVPQGLSSAIFTLNIREAEEFISAVGSDCGIANVNIGTSGAEIGGAFGGEKETGGGRESGSDAWKFYMRQQTNTINWGSELPLAQGIKFDI